MAVFYVMCLLLILNYVFSIALTILAQGTAMEEGWFKNVALSMYTLLIYGTFLDNLSVILDEARLSYWPLLALILVFICLAALTVMNMLIGVLCDKVADIAESEKSEMRAISVNEQMSDVAMRLDTNFNGKISYEEFIKIMDNQEALKIMDQVGVSPVAVAGFAELFFIGEDGEQKELTFATFMQMVLDLRSENQATVKDLLRLWMQVKINVNQRIQDLRTQLKCAEDRLDAWTAQIEGQITTILTDLRKIAAHGAPGAVDPKVY